MHMADALISPAVGGTMWAVSGGLILAVLLGPPAAFLVIASVLTVQAFFFAAMMLPIHAAIGLVEGLATATVVSFVARVRPEALHAATSVGNRRGLGPVLGGLVVVAVMLGGMASWFASTHPDGLEWSVARVTGKEELPMGGAGVRGTLAALQDKTAVLPDYDGKRQNNVAYCSNKQ